MSNTTLIERLRGPVRNSIRGAKDGLAMHQEMNAQRAEAADALEAQQKRIDELEQHIADMIDDSGQECACGYDNPTDVCLGHKPMFDRMQKRIDALTEALEPFSCAHDYSTDLNRLKPDANCRPHDMVISREFRKAFEALQPSTTEEKT